MPLENAEQFKVSDAATDREIQADAMIRLCWMRFKQGAVDRQRELIQDETSVLEALPGGSIVYAAAWKYESWSRGLRLETDVVGFLSEGFPSEGQLACAGELAEKFGVAKGQFSVDVYAEGSESERLNEIYWFVEDQADRSITGNWETLREKCAGSSIQMKIKRLGRYQRDVIGEGDM